MLSEAIEAHSFDAFVRVSEPRLHDALCATLGNDLGNDATAEALAYAWEHWSKVQSMENPVGYLYVVGRSRGRRLRRRRVALMPVAEGRLPWVEPDLPRALGGLPEQQRIVVMLLYCFEWTMSEVAELLDVSKSTVQTHAQRGLTRLRKRLKVTL